MFGDPAQTSEDGTSDYRGIYSECASTLLAEIDYIAGAHVGCPVLRCDHLCNVLTAYKQPSEPLLLAPALLSCISTH
jgi:hypothetical protein